MSTVDTLYLLHYGDLVRTKNGHSSILLLIFEVSQDDMLTDVVDDYSDKRKKKNSTHRRDLFSAR